MNHEKKWSQCQRESNEILRGLLGKTSPRSIEFIPFETTDSVAIMTRLSMNVIVYIVQNNPPKKADEKISSFLNCLNCDLEKFIK